MDGMEIVPRKKPQVTVLNNAVCIRGVLRVLVQGTLANPLASLIPTVPKMPFMGGFSFVGKLTLFPILTSSSDSPELVKLGLYLAITSQVLRVDFRVQIDGQPWLESAHVGTHDGGGQRRPRCKYWEVEGGLHDGVNRAKEKCQ